MSGPVVAIHQPQYLPWLKYFGKAAACDIFVHLDTVPYQRDGVQNRNMVKTHQGPRWLTVPVHASIDTTIADVTIAREHWANKHLKTLTQSYGKTEYFPTMRDELAPILESGFTHLADLNIAAVDWTLRQFGIACRQVRASELAVSGSKDDLVIDICRALGAAVYLSGTGARAYQDPTKFAAAGIQLRYQQFTHPTYRQAHESAGFIADLAAIDLLFNMGPASKELLARAAA